MASSLRLVQIIEPRKWPVGLSKMASNKFPPTFFAPNVFSLILRDYELHFPLCIKAAGGWIILCAGCAVEASRFAMDKSNLLLPGHAPGG